MMTRREWGIAMTAYYGGRAECRIRRTPMPVVHVDFVSMYTTVNTLMRLWQLLTAARIDVVDTTKDARRLLGRVTREQCFDPRLWPQLTFYAEIEPQGDILPVRTRYRAGSREFNIGINPLTAKQPLWFAGPDLVAAVLLTGMVPRVRRAWRLVPKGRQAGLRPVRLRGDLDIDAARHDFFRRTIEMRKALRADSQPSAAECKRLQDFLKVLANAGSYGIFAEFNATEQPGQKRAPITVWGLHGSFVDESSAPELPGRYCFPPLAALIPAAARLMLALLERVVTDAGGRYVFCDTDSMAIVATRRGGLVACAGGPARLADGRPAIRALSWAAVDAIVRRFGALNPYDRAAVPGSILEVKEVNFDEAGRQRELLCYSISAKRYTFLLRGPRGRLRVHDPSNHGLGHLLSPVDPDDESRDWIAALWQLIVDEELGYTPKCPRWLSRPAVSRLALTSPQVRKVLGGRLWPMTFVLSAHVAPLGHPVGVDPEHFHLIRAYTREPRRWTAEPWIDVHSGRRFPISTDDDLSADVARVKTYADVLREYRVHPEPKSAAPDGTPCGPNTIGLLVRRPICAFGLLHIGKEANRLEEVEAGLVHEWAAVQQTYADPRDDLWHEAVGILRGIPLARLAAETGVSERHLRAIRNGRKRPSPKVKAALVRLALDETARTADGTAG